MPLQQLVHYFNDRFEREHQLSFHPFILEDGKVSGLFGPIRVGSVLAPLREESNRTEIVGHRAYCSATAYDPFEYGRNGNHNPVNFHGEFTGLYDTIVNLDRLMRTVHMLNYLPLAHLNGFLVLPVDPRHILGVQQGHGAYFAEVIENCGLSTQNVVISTSPSSVHDAHSRKLFKGLENYRQRGYRIALDIGHFDSAKNLWGWLIGSKPDFVRIRAHKSRDPESVLKILDSFTPLLDALGTQTILRFDRPEKISIASSARIDLIEGEEFNVFSYKEMPEAARNLFSQSNIV